MTKSPFHNFPRTPAQEAVQRVMLYSNVVTRRRRSLKFRRGEALVFLFSNTVISFIHHWTRIDLPVNLPAKF